MTVYFAVKDACVNPETGEKDEAGMVVETSDYYTVEEMIRMVEDKLPCYAGRLRPITREEYEREYE